MNSSLCLCRKKGILHLLRNCDECPSDEHKVLIKQIADNVLAMTPHAPSLVNKSAADPKDDDSSEDDKCEVRHLGRDPKHNPSRTDTSGTTRIAYGMMIETAFGRWEDGSDETIVSPHLAEQTVHGRIG